MKSRPRRRISSRVMRCALSPSGALTGSQGLPEAWGAQVDYAASINPHTNTQRTLHEHADGLYDAFQARLRKLRAYAEAMAY